jgi:YD repeat-containing protein
MWKIHYSRLISLTVIALILSVTVCYAQSVNYAYDELNRLKQVDSPAVEYTYDSAGNRLEAQSLPSYTIIVTKNGTGTGTVSGAGFNCGSDCSESKPFVSVVLTAVPNTGSTFASWSNCDSSNGNQCTMQYDANKTVVATFTEN